MLSVSWQVKIRVSLNFRGILLAVWGSKGVVEAGQEKKPAIPVAGTAGSGGGSYPVLLFLLRALSR